CAKTDYSGSLVYW
nr:immunoglobulin heavy chain junction region [Macaca mulatta]MOX65272.1 immunoglobulin heavy chain junction region [Macaca mulatta]